MPEALLAVCIALMAAALIQFSFSGIHKVRDAGTEKVMEIVQERNNVTDR
jgi:hypothetical protein